MLADWHRSSWFVTRGGGRRICTRVGTRPGDPLADLIFAMAFAIFQQDASIAMREKALTFDVPVSVGGIFAPLDDAVPGMQVWPICYLDDAAILLRATSPLLFFAQVRTTVAISQEVGMQPWSEG